MVRVAMVTAALWVLLAGAAQAQDRVGVIVVHGKWGSPDRAIVSLADALEDAGALVVRPEMPWSGRRDYNRSYEEALAELDAAVQNLRRDGATRVVIAGHSLGANAAIAYASRHPGLAGVAAIAPGHTPESTFMAKAVAPSVEKARALVAAGQGDRIDGFLDLNSGSRSKEIRVTAAIYLSFNDPDGPASMSRAAPRVTAPVYWVVGEMDPMSKRGTGYVFDRLPPRPLNKYEIVPGDHLDTPDIAKAKIVAWIMALPAGQ